MLILNAVILNVVKNLLKADQGNSVYSVLPARRYFASLNMTTHAISVFATSLMSLG